MTKYIIQTYKVIKNNFIINSDSNLSTDNLELNIAGTTALPKNITDLKNENVIIQLKLKLGNENRKYIFILKQLQKFL